VESKGQRLLLWGDTIHLTEVQFTDPDLTIDYDVDRNAATASRKKLLAEAAARGYLVGGAHISFPGLGHVSADRGYHWIPLPYSATVVGANR
jgi:glyoxylase-like metal-dependent hydrolase (beta-lactamase superfamily II)